MSRISARKQTTIAALVIFCLIPFIRLGEGDLQNDEVVYASRVQEIVASGNLLPHVPLRILYGRQPPLLFWAGALAVKLFGFSSFTVRLIPALSACMLVVALYWLALLFVPQIFALGASGLLAASSLFLRYSQMFQMDVPCIAVITAAFALFWYYRELRKQWMLLLAGALFGAAFEAKLFMAFLPLAAFILWILLERETPWRDVMKFLGVIALVALPWLFWSIAEYGQEFFDIAVKYDVIQRVTMRGAVGVKALGKLYYINQLLIGFPLVVITGALFVLRVKQAMQRRSIAGIEKSELFLWLWLVIPIVAMSVMATEMQSYTVELLPPLALLTMLGIQELSRVDVPSGWRAAAFIAVIADCAWGFSQVVRDGAREFFSPGSARAPVSDTPFLIAFWIVIAVALAVIISARGKSAMLKNVFLAIPVWGVVLLVGIRVVVAAEDTTVIRTTGARQIAETLPQNAPVGLITGSPSEDDARIQFHCYDASKTLYRRLMLFNRDTFALAPAALPDSIHFVALEKPDPYLFTDTSGRTSEANLLSQHYVILLQLPKYELFARGLARDLIQHHE